MLLDQKSEAGGFQNKTKYLKWLKRPVGLQIWAIIVCRFVTVHIKIYYYFPEEGGCLGVVERLSGKPNRQGLLTDTGLHFKAYAVSTKAVINQNPLN